MTVAVEFRDASWLPRHTEETLALLSARGLAYVSVDAPRTPASVADTVALTAPTAVIRLHGRNREGFMKQLQGQAPTVAEKYGYLYDRAELTGIVARGRALGGQARRVYFKLNNNVGDAPAINAARSRSCWGSGPPIAPRWRRNGGAAAAPARPWPRIRPGIRMLEWRIQTGPGGPPRADLRVRVSGVSAAGEPPDAHPSAAEAPRCPRCGSAELSPPDVPLRHRQDLKTPASTPSPIPSQFGDLDENDPRSVARFMKKMGHEMGEDLGEDLDAAMDEAMAEGDGPEATAGRHGPGRSGGGATHGELAP